MYNGPDTTTFLPIVRISKFRTDGCVMVVTYFVLMWLRLSDANTMTCVTYGYVSRRMPPPKIGKIGEHQQSCANYTPLTQQRQRLSRRRHTVYKRTRFFSNNTKDTHKQTYSSNRFFPLLNLFFHSSCVVKHKKRRPCLGDCASFTLPMFINLTISLRYPP